MLQRTGQNDLTADRLRALTARLDRCLSDAGHVRVRFQTARDANAWPDMRHVPSSPCSTTSPYKR
jgi:hypothetical protein